MASITFETLARGMEVHVRLARQALRTNNPAKLKEAISAMQALSRQMETYWDSFFHPNSSHRINQEADHG